VVVLGTAETKVLVGRCLPVGFLNLWCHIVMKAVGGFHRLMVGDIGVVGLANVAEVAMDGGWVRDAVVQTDALASIPLGKGYRLCIGALQVLLFLY
jgi:hypothetical protein